jgi:hypothetical protein
MNATLASKEQSTLTRRQQEVYDRILALRKLTAETGTRTTKTQNDLLQAQTNDDLAAVALALYGK